MRLHVLLILTLANVPLTAQQFSSDIFHEGFVVNSDQDTIKGQIKYDMETNSLLVRTQGKMKSLSSQSAFYFEIFDELQNNYRRFYALPFEVNYGYKVPVFFEVVYEGKTSLLSREAIVQQTINSSSPYWGGATYTQLVVDYEYFFLDNKGEITLFSGKKKDLFYIFPRKQSELKDYIKKNKLDVNDRADLIRIMSFYNSI